MAQAEKINAEEQVNKSKQDEKMEQVKQAEQATQKEQEKGEVKEQVKGQEKVQSKKAEEPKSLSKFNPKRLLIWYSELSRGKKILICLVLSILLFLAVFIPTAVLLKLDSIVFPSTLEGYITQYTDSPIEKAKVCVGNKCDETDDKGFYSIKHLSYGRREVKLSKDGFQEIEQDIDLKRGDNRKDFEMKVEGMKDISGQFLVKGAKLIPDNFLLISGDKVYEIVVQNNGSFTLKNIEIADLNIEISSVDYMDSNYKLDPTKGEIDLGDIILTPAGDISFTPIDFLSQEFLEGTKVNDSEIDVVTRDGKIYIEDLKIGEEGKYVVNKEGYNSKTITVNSIKQGDNAQGELKMSEQGKVVYISNRTGNYNVYISNYDGTEEKLLSGNKGNNTSPYYDQSAGVVYFLSDRDRVKNENGDVIELVYKVDLNTLKATKVTKVNYTDTGSIGTYNLKAGKRLDSREHPDYPNTWQFFFGSVDGTGQKQIFHSADNLYNFSISDSGNLLMYSGSYSDTAKNGVYLYNTQTAKQNRIYETSGDTFAEALVFSSDSNYGLLKVYKSGQSDLVVRDFDKGESTQITTSSSSENNARFGPNNKISFISSRDNQSNIYLVDLDGKNEKRLTKDGKIYEYMWSGDLIFYTSENRLWVVSPDNPEKTYQVSSNAQISNYFNFGSDCCWGTD